MVEEQDGEITFLPTFTLKKKYIYIWNNSCRRLLDTGRRPQTSKKASLPLQNEVGQKLRKNEETKDLGQGPVPWGGSQEGREVSAYLETPSWAGMGRASEPQRGTHQQILSR